MIRTQVYLTEDIHQGVSDMAAREQKPAAQVIRELLQVGLEQKGHRGNADGLLALAELGKKLKVQGPAELSSRIDDYLYGDEE